MMPRDSGNEGILTNDFYNLHLPVDHRRKLNASQIQSNQTPTVTNVIVT